MSVREQIYPDEGYLDTSEGRLHYLDWEGSGNQVHLINELKFKMH